MVEEVIEDFAGGGQKRRLNQGGVQMDYSSNQNTGTLRLQACNLWEFHIPDKFFELGFH